jgi:hypothetical protein
LRINKKLEALSKITLDFYALDTLKFEFKKEKDGEEKIEPKKKSSDSIN